MWLPVLLCCMQAEPTDEDYDSEGMSVIIIESGSLTTRAGTSSRKTPLATYPSIVGRKDLGGQMAGMGMKTCWVGSEVTDDLVKSGKISSVKYPMDCGVVSDWSDMERLWYGCFYNEIRRSPDDSGVLVTEPPLNPKANREKQTQVIMETFNPPFFCSVNHAYLALLQAGFTTGTVVDIGHGACYTVPFFEGYSIPYATEKSNVAGKELTNYMRSMYSDDFPNNWDPHNDANLLKETRGYVALDYEAETVPEETYQPPDRSVGRCGFLNVRNQRFQCGEALFKPFLMQNTSVGIHEQLHNSIMKCEEALRPFLFSSVVLSGGSSLFPGLEDRLHKELVNLGAPSVKVIAEPGRQNNFLGAVLFTQLPNFEKMRVARCEYDEYGPAVVHRKFLW